LGDDGGDAGDDDDSDYGSHNSRRLDIHGACGGSARRLSSDRGNDVGGDAPPQERADGPRSGSCRSFLIGSVVCPVLGDHVERARHSFKSPAIAAAIAAAIARYSLLRQDAAI
jgi:hypothetical protein